MNSNRLIFEDETERKMTIELTSVCNKRCKFCICNRFKGIKLENKFLTFEQLNDAIQHAKEMELNTLSFTGGEPTLHPNFKEMMKICKETGFSIKVITNYTRPDILQDAEEFIDRIHISYYRQKNLPQNGEFKHADLYLLTMISKSNFPTLASFDKFLNEHTKNKPYKVHLDMIRLVNDFAKDEVVDFIDIINDTTIENYGHQGEKISFYKGFKIHRRDLKRDFARTNIAPKYLLNGKISEEFSDMAVDTEPVKIINSLRLTLRYEHNKETRNNIFKSLDSACL